MEVRNAGGRYVLVFIYYHPAEALTSQSVASGVRELALSSSTVVVARSQAAFCDIRDGELDLPDKGDFWVDGGRRFGECPRMPQSRMLYRNATLWEGA